MEEIKMKIQDKKERLSRFIHNLNYNQFLNDEQKQMIREQMKYIERDIRELELKLK